MDRSDFRFLASLQRKYTHVAIIILLSYHKCQGGRASRSPRIERGLAGAPCIVTAVASFALRDHPQTTTAKFWGLWPPPLSHCPDHATYWYYCHVSPLSADVPNISHLLISLPSLFTPASPRWMCEDSPELRKRGERHNPIPISALSTFLQYQVLSGSLETSSFIAVCKISPRRELSIQGGYQYIN